MMGFYLSVSGQITGPHDEEEIVERIRGGMPREAQIRESEEVPWRVIGSHPVFADALRRHSPTIRLFKRPAI